MTTPLVPTQPASSTFATPTPVRPTPKLTPYQEFLYRQGLKITARGGSLADVADYLGHAEQRNIRHVVEAQNTPNVDVEAPGMVRGLSQQVLQGATFFFGDEALGSLYGMASGTGAQDGRDYYRAELSAYREKNPILSVAANVAGMTLIPLTAVAAVLGGGGKVAAAGVGAVAGGASAAGEATGGLSERAKSALGGATLGAVLGAASVPVSRAIGKAVGPTIRRVGEALSPASEKVGRWLRDLGARLPGSPQRQARTMLLEALKRDGITPAGVAFKSQQRAAMGLPTTVADLTGDHTMQLAKVAQQFRSPNAQRLVEQIVERQSLQDVRALRALGDATRLGSQNAYELAETIASQRAAQSAPLYERAFAQSATVTPKVKTLLEQATWREAYGIGRATALQEDAAQMARGLAVPELGEVVPGTIPIRALDYMKRGLDHMIERAGQEGRPPLSRQTARALRKSLNEALDEIGTQVPDYAQARSVWRGFSEQLDDLTKGRENFMRKPPEMVRKELADAKAPDMYRIGAMQDISDAVHGVGSEQANIAQRFFGARVFNAADRTALQRIEALIPDPSAAREFADRIAGEVAVTRTTQRLGKAGLPRPRSAAQTLTPPGFTQRMLKKVGVAGQPNTERAAAIADELTQLFARGLDDPNDLVALLHSIGSLERGAQLGAARIRIGAGEIAGRATAEQ